MNIEKHWSDDLELSVRAGNILRKHFATPDDVLAAGMSGLKKIDGCGPRTAREIMDELKYRGGGGLTMFRSEELLDELVRRGVLRERVFYEVKS